MDGCGCVCAHALHLLGSLMKSGAILADKPTKEPNIITGSPSPKFSSYSCVLVSNLRTADEMTERMAIVASQLIPLRTHLFLNANCAILADFRKLKNFGPAAWVKSHTEKVKIPVVEDSLSFFTNCQLFAFRSKVALFACDGKMDLTL